MSTFIFRGTLTLLSPLAISLPGSKPASASDPQPPPVTTIYREGEGLVDTVFLPSASFRGPLRRAGTQAIVRQLREDGKESAFPLRTGYMLNIGGTRGRGSSSLYYDVSAREALRNRNVQIAVFGAADTGDQYFVPGRLSVDHAHPRTPISVAACPAYPGMRTDDMLRSPDKMLSILDADAPSAWDMMFKASTETSAIKKERKTVLAQAMKAKAERDSAVHEEKIKRVKEIDAALLDGGQSVAMPLAGYQAIPTGTILEHRMVLDTDRPAELGLVLAAIELFAEDPYLGGHRAHGCGRFLARWQLEHRVSRKVTQLGEIVIDGEGFAQMPDTGPIHEAREAFVEAVRNGDFQYRFEDVADAADAA
ncbi:hypothetical protein E4T66_17685 [Sinimarinibacterium sp. CAU 1509]|uniref:hypothetical protein n=1 Tax=Sinimarinibacterium sp. CAU 1509 TaxID=2562283 RepID=UPI0010AC99EF|nr:hypothetical protein [Sinimarinibacterium sp. CAU 1509]TJY57239.1 hypothetical protein E4T66_17685 [Sinimarinibacterium sp. CAU 1509]